MLTYNQIIRRIEKECGFNSGDISNNPQRKDDFTNDVNVAMDEVYSLIFNQGGTWQFDDTNHPKYPILTTDLNNGQREYTFLEDGQGNLILDFYKLLIKTKTGEKVELTAKDMQTKNAPKRFFNDQSGQPTAYDKTANGIFFDFIPDYSADDGIEIYINRTGSYFDVSDTDKQPGFAGTFHELLVLIPSYQYARQNSLASVDRLDRDIERMKDQLKRHYGNRERDIKRQLIPITE